MLEWLSDDPWYVVGFLGFLALAFLIALKFTQQGKFLLWAGIAAGLAVAILGIEHFWVTEAERIEDVVKQLGRAVGAADADATLALLTDDVQFTVGDQSLIGEPARQEIRRRLEKARFDFLTVSRLEAEYLKLSKRGKARFRVHTSGTYETGVANFNFATDAAGSDWEVGLEPTPDGGWAINRISALRLPGRFNFKLGGHP